MTSPASATALSAPSRRARLVGWGDRNNVPVQAVLFTVGVVVAVYLLGALLFRLREILLLLVTAGFIALVLDPAVVRIQGWRRFGLHRRGVAVGIVTAVAVLVFVGLLGLFGYPLVNGITHFADNLPKYVSQAEHGKGYLGHLVRKYHVESWVRKNAPKLASDAKNLAKPALSIGRGAVSLLLSLFFIFVLVVLLLLEGPRIRRTGLQMMSPERAERVTRVAGEVSRSVTGFMAGKFVLSLAAGTVTLVVLQAEGVPFAILLALFVALVDFLPMIGGALAYFPAAAVVAVTQPTADWVIFTLVFGAYWFTENHILNPLVMSRTVRINPLLVLIAVLFGASLGNLVGGFFGGFVGTLVAIPLAGSIQVVARELWKATDGHLPATGDPATTL